MNGTSDIISLSTPIPTTTGLCKPLTDNAPDSLAPMLASLTDKVNHTGGLADCAGALHLQKVAAVCNVPMMDVLRLVAASSSAPPPSTPLSLSAIPPPLLHPFFTPPPPLLRCCICVESHESGGRPVLPLQQQECQDNLQVAGTHTGLFPGLTADLSG